MRILTWNVNVLRTVLDYHPWSSMPKKNVEGLLDELKADILCFQEHKTVRQKWTKDMACPGPYDCFITFPRGKTGYSGVCTYVNSQVCVPLYAEEGITGLLLDDPASTMKPPWTEEERIGHYASAYTMDLMANPDGSAFDPRRLDTEGRAVVLDFGLFVLFNLYCPNETNEERRPYKMNFLEVLQARVTALMQAGREVIVAGDINVVRAPIDTAEGLISPADHYSHPARVWLDEWCAPKGPMIDVVRESFPTREGMYTCWNTKIDARPANYGTRIDYILCSPGLRPWIKSGDIQAELHGSDHCPVFIDLHDSIETPEGETLNIRDLLNPSNRPPSTGPVYPTDKPRTVPEPPRFATKFFEEFSGKQRTLKSLWAKAKPPLRSTSGSASPSTPLESEASSVSSIDGQDAASCTATDPLNIARSAFNYLPTSATALSAHPTFVSSSVDCVAIEDNETSSFDRSMTGETKSSASGLVSSAGQSSSSQRIPPKRSAAESDCTKDVTHPTKKRVTSSKGSASEKGKGKATGKTPAGGQQKLAAFWSQPAIPKASASAEKPASKPSQLPATDLPHDKGRGSSGSASLPPLIRSSDNLPDTEQDELLAQALADEEEERDRKRQSKNEAAAPIWNNLFAKKIPPLCSVHRKPCKDHIVKIPGPNKGKRFWLCSMPVGPGYDAGRSRRPREDVNPEYRCDFFLWDSANQRKEAPKPQ